MKLSRAIAYGIHATVQLARLTGGPPTPSSQLARESRLPKRFLVQILRCLVTHDVLTSASGVSGGYSLARPPAQITLRDIVESFDGPFDMCLADFDCMSQGVRSQIASTLDIVAQAARTKLQRVTLADLLLAETGKAEPARINTLPPIVIHHPLIESNEYETPTRN